MKIARYHVGDKVGGLTLVSCQRAHNFRWLVRCACGSEFYREQGKLLKFAPRCYGCTKAKRGKKTLALHAARCRARGEAPRENPPPCHVCFDLPHRIETAHCHGCKKPFQEQPETRAEVRWQSSAGYALAFAHG